MNGKARLCYSLVRANTKAEFIIMYILPFLCVMVYKKLALHNLLHATHSMPEAPSLMFKLSLLEHFIKSGNIWKA